MKYSKILLSAMAVATFTFSGCGGGGSTDTTNTTDTTDTTDNTNTTTAKSAFSGDGAAAVKANFTAGTNNVIAATEEVTLSGDITSNMTLDANKVYKLDGAVKVKNGATLTIPAGTYIHADGLSYLLVTKGSKLDAQGTAAKPIIFTSTKDFKTGKGQPSDWGGVVLLGNAHVKGGTANYEAMDATDADGIFGGDNDQDSSGKLSYVHILYSGKAYDTDKEINGLSLCAVGSNTTIDHIYIEDSGDDGIEHWGGTDNLSNVTIINAGDDSFDVDDEYKGTVTNLVIKQEDPGFAAFEMSNGAELTVDGFTAFIGAAQEKEGGIYFKDDETKGHFKNGNIIFNGNAAANGVLNAKKALTQDALDNISFDNVQISGKSVDEATETTLYSGAGAADMKTLFENGTNNTITTATETVTGDITADTTWKADTIYTLDGAVKVKNGATLTIEAGTIIHSDGLSYLLVTKGSKLDAQGTAAKPIIFTSTKDFQTGNGQPSDWGGVVLLGNAHVKGGTANYEAMDATDADGIFGGTNNEDSSGTLSYVDILYSGKAYDTDKEINGLSLCAVGSNTTIDNIFVKDSGDDAIEHWGGTDNLTNVMLINAGDDSFDVDDEYKGTVKNLVIRQEDPGFAAFEMSNGAEVTVDGFTAIVGAAQEKEGGIYFKDDETKGHFKNGKLVHNGSATNGAIYAKKALTQDALDGISFENVVVTGLGLDTTN